MVFNAVAYLDIAGKNVKKPATATKIPAKMEAPVLKRTLGLNASVPHSGTV